MRISDWNSDVCSSDLVNATLEAVPSAWSFARATWEDTHSVLSAARAGARAVSRALEGTAAVSPGWYAVWASEGASDATRYAAEEIGRASCRERGCQYV